MLANILRGAHRSLRGSRITITKPSLSHDQPRSRYWSTLSTDEVSLNVHSLNTSFPYVWLRDSCQSSACIHPTTSQKFHRTSDIPLDIKPVSDGLRLADDGIHIAWTDGHESFFHASFLERHSSSEKLSAFHRDIVPISWNNSSISGVHNLFFPYESLKEPIGLLSAMLQISKYGILFVSGVHSVETSHEKCELRSLAELFGEIRPTFYGLLWDVINMPNSRNIAYTNLDLGLHMDLLYVVCKASFCTEYISSSVKRYFQHPPKYQILHCLRNRVQGGKSTFVDGLHAASILLETHPSDFEVLATTPVAFHYINDSHHLHHVHPTIELSRPFSGAVGHINYSPPFQAPLPLSTPGGFYPALQQFTKILNDPEHSYQYTLQEGDAVIFDNRRVLHARTAFSNIEGQVRVGEANRWLKGCYLEADSLMDRERVLSTNFEQGL